MKILWLTNMRLPIIDEILGKKANFFGGGWLSGLLEQIINTSNDIVLCYPEFDKRETVSGKKNQISFYGVPIDAKKNRLGTCAIDSIKNEFKKILEKEKPDVIHIHGTEFQFAYAMALAADDVGVIERVAYAHHFFGNLPRNYTPSRTLKEWIIKDGAKDRYNAFVRRGKYETETIKLVKNILGRTRWDYINCLKINPDMNYYKANETLRNSFYSSVWNYESCVKHTIFVSQAGTILKSFHMVLDAITIVKKFYPNVQVKVAGPRIIEGNRLKGNSYGLFIKNKIQSLELENNVEFLGPQNEIQMKEHMLKSNVFVSASSIENSPNSLGEAMLLGMPCISSDVGGVSDLMQHNEEGYIYPADAPEMLAYYIIKVFEDGKTAEKYGKKARVHAMDTHNPQQNWNDLWKIYSKLMEESRKKG